MGTLRPPRIFRLRLVPRGGGLAARPIEAHRSAWLGAAALAVALWAAPSAAQPGQAVVFPMVGYGVPADQVERLEASLQTSVAAATGLNILAEAEARELIVDSEQTLECVRTDVDCAVEIGRLIVTDPVILAEARAQQDGSVQLRLTIVDVVAGRADRETTGDIPRADPDRAIRQTAFRAFHDSAARLGGIRVSVVEAGAEVRIDGDPVGLAPLPGPIWGLTSGAHEVAVHLEGHEPKLRTVDVPPGSVVEINVQVIPPPVVEEGLSPAVVENLGYTVLSVAAGMVVAGGLVTAAGAITMAYTAAIGFNTWQTIIAEQTICATGRAGCRLAAIDELRQGYDRTLALNWTALVVTIVGAVVLAFGLGGSAAGGGVLLFVDTEVKRLEEGDATEQAAPPLAVADPDGPLWARVVAEVSAQRRGR